MLHRQPLPTFRGSRLCLRFVGLAALVLSITLPASAELIAVEPDTPLHRTFEPAPDALFSLLVSLRSGDLTRTETLQVTVSLPDGGTVAKTLHAGDTDVWLPIRSASPGRIQLSIHSSGSARSIPVQIEGSSIPLGPDERAAIEAEPNNDWHHANPLILGRDVYGSADDVDYLQNEHEGRDGLDWFRLEVTETTPSLVFFHLDLTDRDVSADLRLFTLGADNTLHPFETGKDPMETIHDRERVRYSTHLSRILSKGTYYLCVNANHPSYVLRTRQLPLPPYTDPKQAVDVGLHYLQNAGDAWFSQIPREGNRTVRSASLHETSTRCTACHAAAFPLDATLWAHRKGYPIRNRSGVQYLDDRLRASITPLPGFDDQHWQRFIATPLESQGLQGGLVADFDRQITGAPDPTFNRFVPFLRSAWSTRTSLPEDERNGVVPLDSKFELAWRDWQVLTESARRLGDRESFEASKTIERLVADPASDLRVETFQDRLHRLLCWWMFDMEANSGRIFDESEAIFRLQNDDGGWHETDGRSGPSADYATGQVVWTLLQVGISRDDPRIQSAVKYLLARQQPFGGWFQPETHENFRTPMRETRFAVMALASAFPNGEPRQGWVGTGEDPRSSSVVTTLDDLDDLWDHPSPKSRSSDRSVLAFLDHPVPLVRAHAASCLGRIGTSTAISSLVGCLDDPSKIVVRAASESIRRLGRAGLAGDALVEALSSRDPLMRRGAARVFEKPFPGLDQRLDLATRLLLLSDAPDLWTRLSVARALRQWFYRTSDPALQRRIVFAFLGRMALETDPIVAPILSRNLYMMLDENLGGGVSLQKNLMALPEPLQARALDARRDTEQRVLLGPILSALVSAEDRQRASILASFDGSFLAGRTYARQPSNQIDVGNDREFGFLIDPPLDLLERAFSSVFRSEHRPVPRVQAIELAEFFHLPARTASPDIQAALIDALTDPDASVQNASRQVVANSLSLRDLAHHPEVIDRLAKALGGDSGARRALSQALVRSPDLLAHPDILGPVRRLLDQDESLLSLISVLADPSFTSEEVLEALRRGHRLAETEADSSVLLTLLGQRLDLLDVPELSEIAQGLLLDGLKSPLAPLRHQALGLLEHRSLRNRPIPPSILREALMLRDPDELATSLTILENQPDLGRIETIQEPLLRLLRDPSPKVRAQALQRVAAFHLLRDGPASFSRRARALMDDPLLGTAAKEALLSEGLDPGRIPVEAVQDDRQPPSFSVFRDRINPLFYRVGPDGVSCADCHVNHSVLRLSDAESADALTESDLRLNYTSALRVINVNDPSASPLLVKPISPPGQGDDDPESPTGRTHLGGTRWSGRDHPAYQEILQWLLDKPEHDDGVNAVNRGEPSGS